MIFGRNIQKSPEWNTHASVSCWFAFLSTFQLSNRTPKITRILTLKNAATLTPLSKEGKILIKSLQECKSYNVRQFTTEFMNKGWTKNSINRLPVKFRTVDKRPGSGRRRAHTDNKKAVLSQRWPRDARYISRSWAVAVIWPFEINQDGGGRHLEFIRIEN